MAIRPQKIISLCTGYGGLELGLEVAGLALHPLVYVEREVYAAANLVARMEEQAIPSAPVWDCVDTFDATPLHGIVDGLVGGYPCTSFSVAGKREGLKSELNLWPHFARIVRECEPRWCFLENVANHLNLGFDVVARELQEMGYRVAATLCQAADVGAPHKRERLFILAVADSDRDAWGLDLEERETQGRAASSGSCEAVADPDRDEWRGGQRAIAPWCGDCFPPGREPGDPQWAGWPWPCVESEIRQRADGHPHWVDELRLCGGGVVPLQAAYAFSLLVADMRAAIVKFSLATK
jgi:DNA (cytosine-5)-methyltransferase 1